METTKRYTSGLPSSPFWTRFLAAASLLAISLSACTTNKIYVLDEGSGYFAEEDARDNPPQSAKIVRARPFELDQARGLIVVPDYLDTYETRKYQEDFTRKALDAIGYFGEVITFNQLVARIDEMGIKSEELDALFESEDKAGIIQALAKAYRPFLWLRWDYRHEKVGGDGLREYHQLILANALTLEDVFIAETPYSYVSIGDHYPHSSAIYANYGIGYSYYGYYRSYWPHRRWGHGHYGHRLHSIGARYHRKHHYYSNYKGRKHRHSHGYRKYQTAVVAGYVPHATVVYTRPRRIRTTTHEGNHYPMFNALIDYIKAISNEWPAGKAANPAPPENAPSAPGAEQMSPPEDTLPAPRSEHDL